MKKFIQTKLQYLKAKEKKFPVVGTVLVICILLGIGLYKYISQTSEIPKDIPKFSTQEKRWDWIQGNADANGFPFDQLTDQELHMLVRKDVGRRNNFSCDTFSKSPRCTGGIASGGYVHYAERLKREPNSMDNSIFVQIHDDDGSYCRPGRWTFTPPVDCLSPQEQRKVWYNNTIGYASLLGNTWAHMKLVDMVYSPTCCNYDWPTTNSWFSDEWRKLEAEGNRIAFLLSAIHNLRPSNSVNGLTQENFKQLKIVALSPGVGDREAAYELFKIYKDGAVTTRSYSDAYAWLLVSHKLGYNYATETLKYFEPLIDKEFVVEGQKIAEKLTQKVN